MLVRYSFEGSIKKMRSSDTISEKIRIIETNIVNINEIVEKHIESLSYPMDSWLEDRLLGSLIYKFMNEDDCIGYAGQIEETLQFFYVQQEYFKYAPTILEKVIEEKAIKRVLVITQDSLLSALIAEWDYEKEKLACWFTDSGRVENLDAQATDAVFSAAEQKDAQRIREISGDFFDEVSGGFNCLEERIEAGTIFVLEDREGLLGTGIVEKSQFCHVVSIGMYTAPKHRKKGAAKTVLLNLKEWAYKNNLKPVAGCWYYNTLSRKSLESAGMIATSIGYEAILKGKEKLPLRTGNPPGELVE